MTAVKVCCYNGEWLDELFDPQNEFDVEGEGDHTYKSKADRLAAVKTVLKNIDADLFGVVEAPNTILSAEKSAVTCMEKLCQAAEINARKAIIGFPSAGSQEIALLYDPDKLEVKHAPGGTGSRTNPTFKDRYYVDTDDDGIKEEYKFYRPPLEAEVTVKETGKSFNVLVVHTKSKGIFSSMDLIHRQRNNQANRRKLFAECSWIRKRVDQWLDAGKDVLVMGDFNDGPGMDLYEFQFGRSAVETVIGDLFEPERLLKTYTGRPKWTDWGWEPSTASFKDPLNYRRWVHVLIDHIIVNQSLLVVGERDDKRDALKIWNPFLDEDSPHFLEAAKEIKDALLMASDHFPVTLEIDLP